MENLNFNVEVFNSFTFEQTPQGNIKCPDETCEFFVEINEGQRNLTKEQKQIMWSHVENSHPTLFQKLFEEYEKKEYIPREKKVYHKGCFKCTQCERKLDLTKACSFNKLPYCQNHSPTTVRNLQATPFNVYQEMRPITPNNTINNESTAAASINQTFESNTNLSSQTTSNNRTNSLALGYDTFQSQIELAGEVFTIDPVVRQRIFNTFNEFNIIVCGGARVGKSTLINAMCGEKLAKTDPGLDSSRQGNIRCPDKTCEFFVEINDEQRHLTKEQQQLTWSHVQNSHEDSECINALIHDSNAKIMKFLLKYTSTPMDDQELYKLICEQHKKLQQQLHQVLSSSSSSTQQQPTSFGAL
ncbi:unnamed protein product [Rotaria sordida]|uniref:LIM zinc-binding domain-containing protein n=2 Tax=Rotaria sordida TaxID=392033 RepID=A0A814YGG7_9BILA|nr:unnamed protein product [Rotaria sordida]